MSPRPEPDSESVCQWASSSGLSPCQARIARVSPGLQVQCQRGPFLVARVFWSRMPDSATAKQLRQCRKFCRSPMSCPRRPELALSRVARASFLSSGRSPRSEQCFDLSLSLFAHIRLRLCRARVSLALPLASSGSDQASAALLQLFLSPGLPRQAPSLPTAFKLSRITGEGQGYPSQRWVGITLLAQSSPALFLLMHRSFLYCFSVGKLFSQSSQLTSGASWGFPTFSVGNLRS